MCVIVKHIYGGRHGNQLCQYFLGKIISETLKFKLFGLLETDSDFRLQGINLEYNKENYAYFDTPVQFLGDYDLSGNKLNPEFNLNAVLNDATPRKIVLDGFFQRKNYFLPYKEQIKNWYGYKKIAVPSDHVAMHVRLGDIRQTNHPDCLPLEYYEQALNLIPHYSKLTICTDSPEDSYISHLVSKYNASIFHGNERETITFLASHNNFIQSVGTFSFWAGFFSEGKNIINAIPRAGNNRVDPHNHVDLLLQDVNFKYIKL